MTSTSHGPALGLGRPGIRRTEAAGHGVVRGRRRVLAAVTSTVVALCVAAALGLAGALAVVPAVFGGHTLTVLSGSMSPAIPVGSVVVVLPVRPESVSAGEIVTYATTNQVNGANELVTHRVAGIDKAGAEPVFTTKGDANRVADDRAVDASQLRGRVWYHLPWVGTIRDSVFTRTGAMYAAAAALLVVGLGLLRGIGRSASVIRDRTEHRGE